MTPRQVKIRLKTPQKDPLELMAPYGAVLREVLLKANHSPYREANRLLNCRGLGICGTCQVIEVTEEERERKRSCQIRCFRDLEIELE